MDARRATSDDIVRQLLKPYYSAEPYMNEGISCRVLDAGRLYFNKQKLEKYFSAAQRTEPVYVWYPAAGDGITESGRPTATAHGNETVFIKKLGKDGALKIYIPSDPSGPLNESILDEKYSPGILANETIIATALPNNAILYKREPKPLAIDILHECIREPTIILNARGAGKHQTMQAGDSLKFEDGKCLPLPKNEIDAAWQVSAKSKSIS